MKPIKLKYPCTFNKACHILWLVKVEGTSLTHAALVVGLNVGTVCHVIHRRRFASAFPSIPY
jgi:hypothetical protein